MIFYWLWKNFGADALLRVSKALQTSADDLLSGKEKTGYDDIEQLLDQLTAPQIELVTEMSKSVSHFDVGIKSP